MRQGFRPVFGRNRASRRRERVSEDGNAFLAKGKATLIGPTSVPVFYLYLAKL